MARSVYQRQRRPLVLRRRHAEAEQQLALVRELVLAQPPRYGRSIPRGRAFTRLP